MSSPPPPIELSDATRHQRGAFFTPPKIAEFLANWAVAENPGASVLDPTCGEAVFLVAAGQELKKAGRSPDEIAKQLHGVDVHPKSLEVSASLLAESGLSARLVASDFFDVATPRELGSDVPLMDAVLGNPPFIRYQNHTGRSRKRAQAAALSQGVRLSGLASSWAATLIHSSAFLKPEGRIAMVLPAELLTVGYAEPVRAWLRQRFATVHLVMFEELQFRDAEEQVVLLIAGGEGGCDAFSLHHVRSAEELEALHAFDSIAVAPAQTGKWTDLLIDSPTRTMFNNLASSDFTSLESYGRPELGAVTGANAFFAIGDAEVDRFRIPRKDLTPILPPGSRNAPGLDFNRGNWEALRAAGKRVWLFRPESGALSAGSKRYVQSGVESKVHLGYKCSIRDPWWRPPNPGKPSLFVTYMSHRFPRLISNGAGVGCLNSMHALRLEDHVDADLASGLPILMMNSATLLGAELYGRSYGGGILKLEPREAAGLPAPSPDNARAAWAKLKPSRSKLVNRMLVGDWTSVRDVVDDALFADDSELPSGAVEQFRIAAGVLRVRRTRSAAGPV